MSKGVAEGGSNMVMVGGYDWRSPYIYWTGISDGRELNKNKRQPSR